MVSLKRRIPKSIKDILEKFLRENIQHLSFEEGNPYLLKIKDREVDSDFYFRISKVRQSGTQYCVDFSCKPYSDSTMTDYASSCIISDFSKFLVRWCDYVIAYKEKSIFDDTIIESYQNEYFNSFEEFKLVDENSDIEPFNLQQQLVLKAYFESANEEIEESKNELEEKEYLDLKAYVEDAKSNLGKKTKSQIIKSLSGLFARAQKANILLLEKLMNSFVNSFGAAMGGVAAKAAIDFGNKYLPLFGDTFKALFSGFKI